MLKNIFIDLDDTILDFEKSEAEALRQTMHAYGLEVGDSTVALFHTINAEGWKRLEQGLITRNRLLTARFERLFAEIGESVDCALFNETYKSLLARQVFFVDGALELLQTLHASYDLYLASNGTASVQDGRIERAGIGKYFRRIFISQRIGHNKPAPEFFRACFAEIDGFEKEQTVMIGDSLTSDILGANNAGIKAIWFNPKGDRLPLALNAMQVRSLDEIPDLLKTT
ncbi:MAG: YjjG family noncanonical pyrimidine nucleotidase [Clostridia bacterium]|nr:YjjG family noncanonical pyrimidine nucleotidase [Clostridia bacterium]